MVHILDQGHPYSRENALTTGNAIHACESEKSIRPYPSMKGKVLSKSLFSILFYINII
jgi:hypothetical protein